MKKALLIALLLTVASGTALAQKHQGFGKPAGTAGNPVERLTEQLGLSVNQAAEITAIFETTRLSHEEEQEKNRQINCDIRATTHAQVLEVLSADQEALYAELQNNRKEMRQAFEDMQAERGYGGGRKMLECDN